MQRRAIATVDGVGGREMWVLVRQAELRQAPSLGGVVEAPPLVL